MTNTELIQRFYADVFTNQDLTHLNDMMRADYIQHSPGVADGRAGFKAFIQKFWQLQPVFDILTITASNDMVQLFFKCTLANGQVNKVCDIYRIAAGQIAEHWDVIEHDVANKTAVSGHGIF